MASRAPKNKEAAPVQITAEQILREAYERRDPVYKPPKLTITDEDELAEFLSRKRREFEDRIRRNRLATGNWLRYAAFELEHKEYARARSIFERSLDVSATSIPVWNKYIESEMKARNINHGRNLLDRAVTIMPRVDKFWYKYVYMEETLGNVDGVRQIFERWMSWQPDQAAWRAYIRLESRHGSNEKARAIFERFTMVHPEARSWIKWAKFEEELEETDRVREVFTLAIETLGEEFMDEKLFVAYAKFEARLKEFERARVIYRYALDRLPRSRSQSLYEQYTIFEKQFGDRNGIEGVVVQKRRVFYEQEVREGPNNYDAWFDFARLEESAGDIEKVRDVYERAIAHIPPTHEKRHWRRYIYLWIDYALFEEVVVGDIDRTRAVYKQAQKIVPHKSFTFAKLWLLYAQFEVRQLNLTAARKALGMALGICPKPKLFQGYIELEMQLREFERCRLLFEKFLEWSPSNRNAWIRFAELERMLGDIDRARAIFELAVEQEALETPEMVWKAYIDFEYEEEEYDRARQLYERLLEKTQHVKVWISYARFESELPEDNEQEDAEARHISPKAKERATRIFERALKDMKLKGLKEERVIILDAMKVFEEAHGSAEDVERIQNQMPNVVKKRRELNDGSYEEYFDYLFPSDRESNAGAIKLLQAAQAWKANMAAAEAKKREKEGEEEEM